MTIGATLCNARRDINIVDMDFLFINTSPDNAGLSQPMQQNDFSSVLLSSAYQNVYDLNTIHARLVESACR
jgi:hypothetical protein